MIDESLINKLKKGDLHAFKVLVDEHQKRVLNTCYRFVNNREDAEDLTQEVFIEVYKSISRFRGDSKLSTWIYRIAMTKSLDFLRKGKRKKRFGIMKNIFSDPAEGKGISAANYDNPCKQTEAGERIKILNEALEKLPENQRAAFTLSKYEEISYAEIAEILNTSVSAVDALIQRAKNNLRKRLAGYYEKNIL